MESIFLVDILNKLDSNTYVFICKNKSYSSNLDASNIKGLHLLNLCGGETLYKGRICGRCKDHWPVFQRDWRRLQR